MDELDGASGAAGGGGRNAVEAREAVLADQNLLALVFKHLPLEDLCRAAIVRKAWRSVTDNPDFWETICLKGRIAHEAKVCRLLQQHPGVRVLEARGVPFSSANLCSLLPQLTCLESLELGKPSYERSEVEALGANLPRLTRLVLSGGMLGGHASEAFPLAHPSLAALELEGGRAVRLRLACPALTSLSLRDFASGGCQVAEAAALARVSFADCGKLTDGALRAWLCLEGPHAGELPSLTHVCLTGVPSATDETLRLLGQRHLSVATLHLACCGAITGAGLAAPAAFPRLRHLSLVHCDGVSSTHLRDGVQQLPSLQELELTGCSQVTELRLLSSSLSRLLLAGMRTLRELEARCARLALLHITSLSPGLAAAHALSRIVLASQAVQRLEWSAFPALAHVQLQCPNLREFELSECHRLQDDVFDSLGSGDGAGPNTPPATGALGSPLVLGCPSLRSLKLGECDGLRTAVLRSSSLQSLQLSQCRWLAAAELGCPELTQLCLEECTHLERLLLSSRAMTAMSLGTCPRLGAIAVLGESMEELDLRGCNQLEALQLACPRLRCLDATFCSSLGDAAVAAIAGCGGLEQLALAVCGSVTARGLQALHSLQGLRRLDLSYTPLADPTALYAACSRLTSLTLSNNFELEPAALLPLFPPLPALASLGDEPAPQLGVEQQQRQPMLPELRELDVSYCRLPTAVLAAVLTRAGRLDALAVNGCHGGGATDNLWPLLHLPAPGSQLGGGASGSGAAAGRQPAPAAARPASPAGLAADAVALVSISGPSKRAGEGAAAAETQAAPPFGARRLRSLSMVGSKELRSFCLGLAPAAAAAQLGLLVSGGAVAAVDGQPLVPLATPLAGLRELRLSLSPRLHSLALGLPLLQDLQLNNCGDLRSLALRCPSLHRLSAQACRALSPKALLAAAGGCPELRELDLQYCSQATPELAAALREACPALHTVLLTPPHPVSP